MSDDGRVSDDEWFRQEWFRQECGTADAWPEDVDADTANGETRCPPIQNET